MFYVFHSRGFFLHNLFHSPALLTSERQSDNYGLSACTARYFTSFSECIIDRTGGRTMLYLTCSMILGVDNARYMVSRCKLRFGYLQIVVQVGTCITHLPRDGNLSSSKTGTRDFVVQGREHRPLIFADASLLL